MSREIVINATKHESRIAVLDEGQVVELWVERTRQRTIVGKGARITSHITLPGRFLVYMPTVNHIGVSRRIETEEERMRLKHVLETIRPTGAGGFIVRTAGEGREEEEFRADLKYLTDLWEQIRRKAEKV